MSEDTVWTYVSIKQSGEFPFTMSGFVSHKPDLSDLGEPYLSAVKEALTEKKRRDEIEEYNEGLSWAEQNRPGTWY